MKSTTGGENVKIKSKDKMSFSLYYYHFILIIFSGYVIKVFYFLCLLPLLVWQDWLRVNHNEFWISLPLLLLTQNAWTCVTLINYFSNAQLFCIFLQPNPYEIISWLYHQYVTIVRSVRVGHIYILWAMFGKNPWLVNMSSVWHLLKWWFHHKIILFQLCLKLTILLSDMKIIVPCEKMVPSWSKSVYY